MHDYYNSEIDHRPIIIILEINNLSDNKIIESNN